MSQVNEADLTILDLLKGTDKPVPGTFMAQTLGLSRVALWKRIHHLCLKGYRIESSRRGYRLTEDDAVLPHEFPTGAPVVYHQETASTMDDAWKLAEEGAPSGTLVTADSQTGGRGQAGRPWTSPRGGLYATFILRSALPQAWSGALVMESAWKILEILESHGLKDVEFQWPNDLMQGSKKIGGLLVESAGSPEKARFFTLGVGINVHPLELESRLVASLSDRGNAAPRRRTLVEGLRGHMTQWARQPECAVNKWNSRLLRNPVLVRAETWLGEAKEFTPRGLAPDGALLNEKNERVLGFGESRILRKKGDFS